MEFEANKKGFPKGLKRTVSLLRERNPHIRNVSVWHALVCETRLPLLQTTTLTQIFKLGYWGGIAPDGPIASEYRTIDVTMTFSSKNPGGIMCAVHPDDVKRFYEDFYRYSASRRLLAVGSLT